MRPHWVELSNFRAWGVGPTRIEFRDGITAVTGDNEAGKTSLLEAILWALYGTTAMREPQPGLVHAGAQDMEAAVSFGVDRHTYLVERWFRLNRDRTSGTTRLLFEEGEPHVDDSRDLTQPTVRETEAAIAEIVGTYHVAARTWYSPQGAGKNFYDATPADRRAVFADAIAVSDVWGGVHGRALIHQREAQSKATVEQSFIEQFEEQSADLPALEAAKAETGAAVEQARATVEAATKYADAQRAVEAVNVAQERLEAAAAELEEAQGYIDRGDAVRAAVEVGEREQAEYEVERIRVQAERDEHVAKVNKAQGNVRGFEYAQNLRNGYRDAAVGHKADLARFDEAPDTCPTCGQKYESGEARDRRDQHRADAARLAQEASINAADFDADLDDQVAKVQRRAESLMAATLPDWPEQPSPNGAVALDMERLTEAERSSSTLRTFVEQRTATFNLAADARDAIGRADGPGINLAEAINANANAIRDEATATERLARAREAQDAITPARDALTATQARLSAIEDVLALSAKTGVPQLAIDQVLGNIEATTNEILAAGLQQGTSVHFDTLTETGNETLEMLILAPDGVRTAASRSGGASSRIALALRAALALEAARAHGYPQLASFLCDEMLDSQDSAGREAIGKFLLWLRERVGRIVVISHDASFLDAVDHHVVLNKVDGQTRVAG